MQLPVPKRAHWVPRAVLLQRLVLNARQVQVHSRVPVLSPPSLWVVQGLLLKMPAHSQRVLQRGEQRRALPLEPGATKW